MPTDVDVCTRCTRGYVQEKLFAGVEAEFDGASKRLTKMLTAMAKGEWRDGARGCDPCCALSGG